MKRNLKIFLSLSRQSIKITLHHRVGVITFLTGKIIRFLFFFLFLYFLVFKTKSLAGYNFAQTALFFLTFNFIDTLSQLLFREVYRFRQLVITGQLDNILLKPHHPFIRVLIGGIDILDALLIVPYFFLLIFFVGKVQTANFLNILLYVFFLFNGFFIATSFHIAVLALGILTKEIDHTIMIYRDLTRMVALPVDIYKEPLRSFITFIIPVGIMMTMPVKILFGLLSWKIAIFSLFISFFFLFFSLSLWKFALKKYQSVGS